MDDKLREKVKRAIEQPHWLSAAARFGYPNAILASVNDLVTDILHALAETGDGVSVEEMARVVKQLDGLLSAPEAGLATWHVAVARKLRELYELTGVPS